MDRLWAPWRMEYILSDHGDGCFLCEMLEGAPGSRMLLLARDERIGICLNRYPYNNGHLLVFPRRHVPGLEGLTVEERGALMEGVNAAMKRLRTVMQAEGFNVGVNLGAAAGAGLEGHVHLHVVPRWTGDTNFMPVAGDVTVIPQHLEALREQLRPAFKDLDGAGSG